MLVGIVADPQFGPVVACGAGGTTVELVNDVRSVWLRSRARTRVSDGQGLTTFPLLDGFRGASPKDVDALVDVVLRVASMAEHHPAIVEVDCNPVMVMPRRRGRRRRSRPRSNAGATASFRWHAWLTRARPRPGAP